jgi:hypothetical protein
MVDFLSSIVSQVDVLISQVCAVKLVLLKVL